MTCHRRPSDQTANGLMLLAVDAWYCWDWVCTGE